MLKILLQSFIGLIFVMFGNTPVTAQSGPALRIVALGDSLTAGYGLPKGQDFASRLEFSLRSKGYNVSVDNGGVSGDTTAGGLARIDRLINVTPKPDLVLVELGANDMLRSVPPSAVEANLRAILQKIGQRQIPALLIGMLAPQIFPPAYQQAFNGVYPKLAQEFNVPLYAFFLEGVALNPLYNLPDRAHPNREGVEIITRNILPAIQKTLDVQIGQKS